MVSGLSQRFIVRMDPKLLLSTLGQLQIAGIPLAQPQILFDHLVVSLPAALTPYLYTLSGVQLVTPDSPVKLAQQGAQQAAPLHGAGILPVDQEIEAFFRSLANPVGALLAGPPIIGRRDRLWPTSVSRQVVRGAMADADGVTGKGVKVAVLDTGLDPTTLMKPGIFGTSTVEGEPWPTDQNGHSTHVTTTIAGNRTTFYSGILEGVAPDAEIIIIKVLGRLIGTGTMSGIMNGMQMAADQGAKIISMSLGGTDQGLPSPPEHVAISKLAARGVLTVVAAGNEGPHEATIGTPGSAPDAITVGAMDQDGSVASFSSRGPTALGLPKPDLIAPGVNILSESNGLIALMRLADGPPRLAAISGTSMATPHASGTIALAVEYARRSGIELTTAHVKTALAAHYSSRDMVRGYGLLTYPILRAYIDSLPH